MSSICKDLKVLHLFLHLKISNYLKNWNFYFCVLCMAAKSTKDLIIRKKTFGENLWYFKFSLFDVTEFIDWSIKSCTKELSLWNKIKYLNHNIFRTRCCKPLIFQTQIIWSNRIHSLKYLRSATFGSKDIVIIKSEFVAKTQSL